MENDMKKKLSILSLCLVFTLALTSLFSCGTNLTRIDIVGDGVRVDDNGEKYVVVYLDENDKATYKLEYELLPYDHKPVDIDISYNKNLPGVTLGEDGVFEFSAVTGVEVTVSGKGANSRIIEDKIFIFVKHKNL